MNRDMNLAIEGVSKEAMAILLKQEWKGNIRELKNCLERAVIVADNKQILPIDLASSYYRNTDTTGITSNPETFSLKLAKKTIEKRLISEALKASNGNKSMAARMLEISYPSLLAKIKNLFSLE